MKFIAVPILILLIATQAFSKWVILAEYEWNKGYIAKNHCENRLKPRSACNGKCQLMKAMAQGENEKSPVQQQAKPKYTEVLFSVEISEPENQPVTRPPNTFPHTDDNILSIAPIFAVFRPPIV